MSEDDADNVSQITYVEDNHRFKKNVRCKKLSFKLIETFYYYCKLIFVLLL